MFRYDVALDVNVMGVKYLCQLAKKCANLEVFLHVSTGKLRSMRLERTLDKLTCKLS
jgi:fatty acyl-CoA reductase